MTDFDADMERHQRRMQLMRMMGETNRMEARMRALWVVAAVLGVISLILAAA